MGVGLLLQITANVSLRRSCRTREEDGWTDSISGCFDGTYRYVLQRGFSGLALGAGAGLAIGGGFRRGRADAVHVVAQRRDPVDSRLYRRLGMGLALAGTAATVAFFVGRGFSARSCGSLSCYANIDLAYGFATTIAMGGVATGGALWAGADSYDHTAAGLRWAPTVSASGGGLAASGRF